MNLHGGHSPGQTYGCADSRSVVFTAVDSDVEDRMPMREVSWVDAAWIINASVIGMGVLTIPSCFATLGWLCGGIALVVCLLANVLVARIMLEIHELHPRAISLADAAQIASGGRRSVKVLFRTVLYAEKLACTVAFVNLLADTLGSAFYSIHWCEVSWCGIVVLVFLPLTKLKNLNETFWLNIVNFTSIVAVVVFTCGLVVMSASLGTGRTSWLPAAASPQEALGAVSMMVFAYSGNWMYFELMAEMREPRQFMKAFTIAGPTQLGLYTCCGAVCYGVLGQAVPDSIIEVLEFGPLMRIVSILLALHILCGTGTNMVILIRFFHSRISPKDLNSDTLRAGLIRTVLYLLIICGTLLVSLALQGFGSIVMFIGAVFEAPINFVCPFIIYAGVKGRKSLRSWSARLTWFGALFVAVMGLVVMIFGVSDAVNSLHTSGQRPFSCNCQGIWDTCSCSPSRMPAGTCPSAHTAPPLVPIMSVGQRDLEHKRPALPLFHHPGTHS
mmetsp:Transcript_36012/g.83779  ORF Transcript_36012/g.83779 Transcript_36012/m.83779 type:complete len:500 (-) Transcript_36012:119-1618(-)